MFNSLESWLSLNLENHGSKDVSRKQATGLNQGDPGSAPPLHCGLTGMTAFLDNSSLFQVEDSFDNLSFKIFATTASKLDGWNKTWVLII